MSRLWVVPVNDAEGVEIVRLLRNQGEFVVASDQRWGATWNALEEHVQAEIRKFRKEHAEGRIYGVELGGTNPYGAIDIDHHLYRDSDRRNPLSSIEQVAQITGTVLSRRQQLIAVNDRAYIRGMQAEGASKEEIDEIRRMDRAAQGLTEQDEMRAEAEISRAVWQGRRALVHCVRPTSAHSDRLFGHAEETLLAGENVWSYSGPRHQILAAHPWPEPFWSGGEPDSGYFGIEAPGERSRQELLKFFWT